MEIKTGTKVEDFRNSLEKIINAKNVTNKKIREKFALPLGFIIFTDSKIWKDVNAFGNFLIEHKLNLDDSQYPETIIVWNKFVAWTFHGKPGQKTWISIAPIQKHSEISIALLLGCLDCYLMAISRKLPEDQDWSTYLRNNYFDFEKKKYAIWSKEKIRIGEGIIDEK